MSKTLKTDVVLLTESPASEDLFGGGGHQRTADELVRTLDLLKARGGAVGLEGGWGSGKSTVLQLAKIRLRNRTGIFRTEGIFTFDLWKHQGSDIRETFLLSLLEYVEKDFSGLRPFVEAKRTVISRKVEETEDRFDKTYSLPAILFLLASPLVPLMLAWSGPSASSANPTTPPKILGADIADIFWGVLIVGYGLIGMRFFSRIVRLGVPSRLRDVWSHVVLSLSHSVSAFGKDGENSKQTRYITKLDPVERHFGTIVRETIGELRQKGHTLHIVFDNIDRVDHDKISEFWSHIREAYAADDNDFEPINNPVVIIPFDRSAIQLAQKEHKLSSDIITKTFSRVLRVSTPVLTDWTKFLYICLDRAFVQKIDVRDKYRVGKVLDQRFSLSPEQATPRNIISFVNDLASCWSSWDGAIPLVSISLYLLKREQLEPSLGLAERIKELDPIAKLVSAEPDWFRQIAALIFNVDPDHAYQTLLQPEVLEALRAPNGKKILSLEGSAGFYAVLLRVAGTYSEDWAKSEPTVLAGAASKVGLLDATATEINDIWFAFGRALDGLVTEPLANIDSVRGLSEIVGHQPPHKIGSIARHVASWATQCVSLGPSVKQGETWLLLIDLLRSSLPEDERAAFVGSLSVVTHEDAFVGMAKGASRTAITLEDLSIEQDNSILTASFIAHASELPDELDDTFKNLSPHLTTAQDREIAQSTLTLMMHSVADSTLQNASVLKLVAEAASGALDEPLRTALKASSDGGFMRGAYRLCAATSNDGGLIGAYLWAHFTVHKTHEYVPSTGNPAINDPLEAQKWHEEALRKLDSEGFSELARWSARSAQIHHWIALAIASQHPDSVPCRVLKAMIDSGFYGGLNIWPTLVLYPDIEKLLGSTYGYKLLRRLSNWSKYLVKDFESKAIVELPAKTVLDIFKSQSGLSPLIRAEGRHYFERKSRSEWLATLSGTPDLEHFLAICRHSTFRPPTEPYRGALIDHAKGMLDGIEIGTPAEVWPEIINAMKSTSRSKFINDLFQVTTNTKSTQSSFDNFLIFYGKYLPYLPVQKNTSKVFDYLVIKLLQSQGDSAQSILEGIADGLGSGLRPSLSKAGLRRIEAALSALPTTPSGKAKRRIVQNMLR